MNICGPFIRRPVATTLLTVAIAAAGILGYRLLPVSPLPLVDFPTISVSASMPGASPETMASTIATPLERSLGRIAGITQMTSASTLGSTNVVLQFGLSRDIDGAARDVQAAISAARALLPTGLPANPNYKKVNPANAPMIVLALTSDTLSKGEIYDAASTILAQSLSQIEGVGQASVGGSSLPAVRAELNPTALDRLGISSASVRTTIQRANVNRPKGSISDDTRHWQIAANDQAKKAVDYLPLVIGYHNGAAVRLSDVADVHESIENVRTAGIADGKPAIMVVIRRQPGANIIATADRVMAMLPVLESSIPQAIHVEVVADATATIRASVAGVEETLSIAVALVIMVVFLFLRRWRAAMIPAVAVPVSLIGTFGVMYLFGYSLDNLSLMALTIATGFVVDDAVVVLENVSRHIEDGMKPFAAAMQGAREVGFTVLSMSLSLVAVFIPILLMGGIIGRLFQEFAVTLSAAILVSLAISLTTTPMMCAWVLKPADEEREGRISHFIGSAFERIEQGYAACLRVALRHRFLVLLTLLATLAANVYLYKIVPKGFMPQQDTGRIMGSLVADQSVSFESMRGKMQRFMAIVKADPDVAHAVTFAGGNQANSAFFFVMLKPFAERKASADQIIARLRPKLGAVPGATLFLQAVQDINLGGRGSNAQFQYTLSSERLDDLRAWEPKIRQALSKLPEITDVSTDQQDRGLQTHIVVDRDAAARLGLNFATIDATLNDLFGQRQVSNIYEPLNQYHVVMEAAPEYLRGPGQLEQTHILSATGEMVPLSAISHWESTNSPLAVNHQDQFVATTVSFNLPPGQSLSSASDAVAATLRNIGVPTSIHGSFQGTAQAFQASLANQPYLVLGALLTVYLVLGMLYESLIHPLTIISTLPSAGGGAILALILTKTDFSIIALIGVILLIGIVKKNAILMIDFALAEQRGKGTSPEEAIYQACLKRFRPILMTTLAAMFGAIPLAIGHGDGAELRQPLGIAIIGGLAVSQILTLFTTPVVYLYMEKLAALGRRRKPAVVLVGTPEIAS